MSTDWLDDDELAAAWRDPAACDPSLGELIERSEFLRRLLMVHRRRLSIEQARQRRAASISAAAAAGRLGRLHAVLLPAGVSLQGHAAAHRVEDCTGKVQPVLDVGGKGGTLQHGAHFVADGGNLTAKQAQFNGIHGYRPAALLGSRACR